jgi:hypothetical protein
VSVAPGLRLLPNLGGEEPGDWQAALRHPPVASAARLWRFLFPADARVVETAAAGPETKPSPYETWNEWPACFSDPSQAAFAWLDGAEGWQAWLCDRRAHEQIAALGGSLTAPPGEIVERVHDKAFAEEQARAQGLVPRSLRNASHVLGPEALRDEATAIARIREATRDWPDWIAGRGTLKPRMGTSGRGRVDFRADEITGPDSAGARQLARRLPHLASCGGAVLEPWLERVTDLSASLWIEADGTVVIVGSLELLTTPSGGWRGHRGELDSRGRVFSGRPEDESLREAAAALAGGAAGEGYFGPAGLDALVFLEPDPADDRTPRERLRPVVELNARYTMGIVTIGAIRRALPAIRSELGLGPGERLGFVLLADAPQGGWPAVEARLQRGTRLLPLGPESAAPETPRPALLVGPDVETLEAATSGP